jgi:hypothetical protein
MIRIQLLARRSKHFAPRSSKAGLGIKNPGNAIVLPSIDFSATALSAGLRKFRNSFWK